MISLGLTQIKNACTPVFEKFEKAEKSLLNFERGFILFHMCRIIPKSYMNDRFSSIVLGATQKHIERKEIEDMGTLICMKSRLLLNLKKVLTMSTGFSDKKTCKGMPKSNLSSG